MQRATLKPPSVVRESDENAGTLERKALENGLGTSGGPSAVIAEGVGEGRAARAPLVAIAPPAAPVHARRRSNREMRSFNFNCKMKPSIKASLDEICDLEDQSQADVLERLILAERKRLNLGPSE